MTPNELMEFAGQELADVDHLAAGVIHDFNLAMKRSETLEQAYLTVANMYFGSGRVARLYLLHCLYTAESRVAEDEAERIEMAAAHVAYEAGLGVGEWESFLTPEQTRRLIELADMGYGTWVHEPHLLAAARERML